MDPPPHQKGIPKNVSSRYSNNHTLRVIIEKSENGFGAYVPDLPGCVALGETLLETEKLIKEAIEFHLEGIREDGQAVPAASTIAEYVEI
jgi:predicted RNase H-like HicB family nuclease